MFVIFCNLSINEKFQDDFLKIADSLKGISDENLLKKQYLIELKKLRNNYSEANDENFFNSIEDLINDKFFGDLQSILRENGLLESVLSQDYQGELKNEDPYFVESTLEEQSKTDKIDSTKQEQEKQQFLSDYFPPDASDARLAFEQMFKNDLVQRLFYNSSDGLNLTSAEIDQSIKNFRNSLINDLDTFVKNFFPKNYDIFKILPLEDKLAYFKNNLQNNNISISSIELIKVPILETLTDQDLKSKLKAYLSYIALTHFDDLVQIAFGDSVKILYRGNYDTSEIKYKINLGNKNATGWSDQKEDVDETDEIGSIIRLFMESLNLYDINNGQILPFKMTFQDVKSGIGGIMGIFGSTDQSNKLIRQKELSFVKRNSLSKLKGFYGEKGLQEIYDKYVNGRTIGELVAATKIDIPMLSPILFTILATYSDQFFERYQERQAVYSIWKNVFDFSNKTSLINRMVNSGGINIDNLDLYTYVNALLVNIENNPVIEYSKDTDGKTSLIKLQQNTSNTRLRSLRYNWQALYNAESPQKFKSFTLTDFENNAIKVNIGNNIQLILKSNNGKVNTVLEGELSLEELDQDDLFNFLSEVLNANINSEYLKIHSQCGGNLQELVNIAGTILYNYKVGKHIFSKISENSSTNSKEIYDEEIEKFYSENAPKPARGQMQPELTDKSLYPALKKFALALDTISGYSGDTVAKDGLRKQISLKGLSCLASKYMEIVYNHNLGESSILKNFQLYNLFEEVEFIRDFAQIGNNKEATSFSEAEFFEANFLYDFYGGQLSVSENGKFNPLYKKTKDGIVLSDSKEDTKLRIMGPIISDKSKIAKIRTDWRYEVTLPTGQRKYLFDLTTDEILAIQQEEFGNYYQGIYDRIHQDLNAILPYVRRIIPSETIVLDYDNDYEQFVLECSTVNLDPIEVLHEALVLYQNEARQLGLDPNSITLTERIHYNKGRDKRIHNNPALFHQLSIYGRPVPFKIIKDSKGKYLPNLNVYTINESLESARLRGNLQLLTELLQNEITIRLGENGVEDDSAIWSAKQHNKGWMNGRNLVFAKIGNTNISSLNDFKNWKGYKNLIDYYSILQLPKQYDINSPEFNLLGALYAINIIHKYNFFKFKEVQDSLIPIYLENNLGQSNDILDIIKQELRERHPKWKEETIDRKASEELTTLSKEDIKLKKAKYQLNWDINNAILSEIDGEPSEYFNYENNLQTVQQYLEENKDNIEESKYDKIISRINDDYNIEINPEIERYHTLNNWLGEAYELTSVGTFIAHPGDNNALTIYNYEYGNFGQQVKRNVSHTATKHREVQNTLKGIRNTLTIAYVGDMKNSAITYKGDYSEDEIAVHNGATFYNGTMVDLDNNSLGADAMGEDKKPFIHFMNPQTGIGGIIKTAGFAVLNDDIRSSDVMRRLNRVMNNTIKWTDALRRRGINRPYFDWTQDFKGISLDFKNGWVVQKGDKFFKFTNPRIDENGITVVDVKEIYSNGETSDRFPIRQARFAYTTPTKFEPLIKVNINGVNETLDLYGNIYESSEVKYNPINSNWELWNVFGGEYSCHLNAQNQLTPIQDNNSFKLVNYVMNHTGEVVNKNLPLYSQSNIYQVLKHSQIDIIPTTEAGKFGATNINSTRLLEDDSYVPTYMECFSDDFGEQLDAEHTAEGGHVSLMTQVINALGARGYSKQEAEECYQALMELALSSFEEAFDEMNVDNEKFKVAIANIMLQTLNNVPTSDGNILSAIAQGLKHFQRFGNSSQLEGVFPISSPQIYANVFSKLASALEKASIRLKFEGGMLVLNPSDGIYKIVNGKLLGTVSQEEIESLQNEAVNNPLQSASQIKFGRYYYIVTGPGIYEPRLVDSIEDFYTLKSQLNSGAKIFEAFQKGLVVSENNLESFSGQPIGRDLATYDCTITQLNSNNTYSLWETDIVKLMFSFNNSTKTFDIPSVREPLKLETYWNGYMTGNPIYEPLLRQELEKFGISEIRPESMRELLQSSFQNVLNAISNGIGNSVIIDGEEIKIDKNKTVVSPYECIMPMIYKTTFGLRENDTVGEIVQDKYFFLKRFKENSKSKFYSKNFKTGSVVNGSQFDLELKRVDGNHLYLASTKKIILGEDVDIIPEVYGGVLYRVIDGKRAYQIPSKEENGKLVPNCNIIKTFNGTEVIQTDDFLTILESEKFNQINFGDFSKHNPETVKNILEQLEQSSNKTVQNKIEYVKRAVSKKVLTNKEGVKNNLANYSIITNQADLAEAYLNSEGKYETIADIFNDVVGFNALQYHELYTQDASNQQKLLDDLVEVVNDDVEREEFLNKYPHLKHLVSLTEKQHVSFLTSLESVVSRTPAQSHQSFMAMRVAGFDTNTTNSIYVSRMQLYLQGSDFDIDKDNVLGLKFQNSLLFTWSPYYDLSTKQGEEDSEKLPFPTGRSITINENPDKLPFDVIEKDYQKIPIPEGGFMVVDNNGNAIRAIQNGDTWYLEQFLNEDGLSQNTYLLQHAIYKNLSGAKIIPNETLDLNVFQFNPETGTLEGINKNADIQLYLNSLNISKTGNSFNNLIDLGNLIRTFSKLKEIPSEFQTYIDIVNKHNTMFLRSDGKRNKRMDLQKRNALYNFVSIQTKNISKNPVNLIQGQSGIDVATGKVKDIVKTFRNGQVNPLGILSAKATTSDHRSVLSRMHQLVLTLTGKQNVGIVASAMKVFEAMSHYYNKALSEGTAEEQERLISKIKVLGREFPLIANSFTKNEDTILTENVLKAYKKVNNLEDAFIWMSALLSLATDNAKDPTLSKLNATQQTLGCYTAGLVLGLSVEDVANLLISKTGLLLTKIMSGNVFHKDKKVPKNLSSAIAYLMSPPSKPNISFRDYYILFGLQEADTKDEVPLSKLLWSKSGRRKFKQMAAYLLHSDSFELENDIEKIAKRNLKELEKDPHYWKWNEESELELEKASGKRKNKLQERYDEYLRIKNLIASYEAYLENPESWAAESARKEIENDKALAEKYSSSAEIQKARMLVNGNNSEVKDFLYLVYEWLRNREIIENDRLTIGDQSFSILSEISKLSLFNEEMGDLRTVLKLNQGLPNSVQDQHNWINNFKGILSRAKRRYRGSIKEDSAIQAFENTYGSLDLDLNKFLNDSKYQNDAIKAYEVIKIGVNIFDVMLNVPHYTGYLKIMNLLYEGGKATSKNYDTQSKLVKKILPELSLSSQEQVEKFFKTLNPVIFNRVNNNFLWQQQIEYEIPKFKVKNGELIESRSEDGQLKFETIRLGTEESNKQFANYCVYYLFSYLKTNYPNNAFVKAISCRTYGFNLDHQVSINIAKNKSYNIGNPTENVQFNEVKKALADLNGIKNGGIVTALFYYNLIAYNGQPGMQSLTDFFEDFIIYDNNQAISDYNKYITYLDNSEEELFNLESEQEIDYLLRVFAPTVYMDEVTPSLKYFWMNKPENNKEVLIQRNEELTEEEREQLDVMDLGGDLEQEQDILDDNENEMSFRPVYKTLSDILKRLNEKFKGQYSETGVANEDAPKKIIMGKEILLNPEIFPTTDGTLINAKNKFLDENKSNILLSINGQTISLENLIEQVKAQKWTKEDIYEGFKFVKRKSKDHTYVTLKYDELKHNLEYLLNNTKDSC